MDVFKQYSFVNCVAECRAAMTFEICGCVPYTLPNNGTGWKVKHLKISIDYFIFYCVPFIIFWNKWKVELAWNILKIFLCITHIKKCMTLMSICFMSSLQLRDVKWCRTWVAFERIFKDLQDRHLCLVTTHQKLMDGFKRSASVCQTAFFTPIHLKSPPVHYFEITHRKILWVSSKTLTLQIKHLCIYFLMI